MPNFNGLRCATGKSDATNDHLTGPFVKQGEVCWRLERAVTSAILNCICPECGGVIELETSELKCLGRCGKRWRDIWVRTQLYLQARKARRSSSPRRTTGVDRG